MVGGKAFVQKLIATLQQIITTMSKFPSLKSALTKPEANEVKSALKLHLANLNRYKKDLAKGESKNNSTKVVSGKLEDRINVTKGLLSDLK